MKNIDKSQENKKLIIFDMDGTLINSGNIIADTINYVRVQSGLELMEKKILLENINNPNINSAKFFYGIDAFTPKHIEQFESYYEEHHLKELVLYDGIKKLLEKLYHKKYILTIATNAHTNFAVSMTTHLGINRYFDFIIGADKVDKPKPNSQMIKKVIKEVIKNHNNIEFKLDDIVLIGDSHKDLMASKDADIECILVNWGFTKFNNSDENIETNQKIANSVEELSRYFYL
jgi:phosphoglycolate phosphatase